MKRRTFLCAGVGIALGGLAIGCASYLEGDAATPSATVSMGTGTYTTHTYRSIQRQHMTYYLYMPKNYDPRQKYPLVLLLHGGGERSKPKNSADQNKALLMNEQYVQIWGPGYHAQSAASVQARWPCFVVVPQIPDTRRWVDVPPQQGSYVLAPKPDALLQAAKDIVDALQCIYPAIDATRLYITGISMGGYGTWEAIERWPDYFAAAAPLAGAGDPSKAPALIHKPIWAFHGSADTTVPPSGSRDMIAAIRAAGGQPRYTEYSGMGHVIWNTIYSPQAIMSSDSLFSWLFSQRNPGNSPRICNT
ncbi:MAG: prolyl oligopeptidase family serine peptidase [Ktedonobacteraceae bacterium]|nr:prolyl oligopeptidase family serine peptidase [Ktedonobacteraceae bacterium]